LYLALEQRELALPIKRVVLAIEGDQMGVTVGDGHAGLAVALGALGLAQVQVGVAQVAPLAAEVEGHEVVEVVGEGGHLAVGVEGRRAQRVVAVGRAARARVVCVHEAAGGVVAAAVAPAHFTAHRREREREREKPNKLKELFLTILCSNLACFFFY